MADEQTIQIPKLDEAGKIPVTYLPEAVGDVITAIENAETVNDPILAGLISDPASQTGVALSAANAQIVPPLVADALSTDPTVAQAAANLAQSDAGLVRSVDKRLGARVWAPKPGTWVLGSNGRGVQTDLPRPDLSSPRAGLRVPTVSGVRRLTSDATVLACHGDSLTMGYPIPPFAPDGSDSWPARLASGWGGTVKNISYHGATAEQIAIRAGAIQLTFGAFTIPATTSAVTAPAQITIEGAYNGQPFTGGSIAGVPVTMTCSTAGVWSVTRVAAGAEVPVPAGTAWVPAADTAEDTTVIMAGRNDFVGLTEGNFEIRVERVLAAVAAMVAHLKPIHPGVLIIPPTTATGEVRDSLGWRFARALRDAMFAEWGARQVYDLRAWLASPTGAIKALGITPTAADTTAMTGDTLPPSIMHDSVHWLPATANVIAPKIRARLDARGLLI